MAGSILVVVPPVLVLLMQRWFVKGLVERKEEKGHSPHLMENRKTGKCPLCGSCGVADAVMFVKGLVEREK